MPLYEKGDVRIHYEEVGAGFPLLVIPGGGLNSTVAGLATVQGRQAKIVSPTQERAMLGVSRMRVQCQIGATNVRKLAELSRGLHVDCSQQFWHSVSRHS